MGCVMEFTKKIDSYKQDLLSTREKINNLTVTAYRIEGAIIELENLSKQHEVSEKEDNLEDDEK